MFSYINSFLYFHTFERDRGDHPLFAYFSADCKESASIVNRTSSICPNASVHLHAEIEPPTCHFAVGHLCCYHSTLIHTVVTHVLLAVYPQCSTEQDHQQ